MVKQIEQVEQLQALQSLVKEYYTAAQIGKQMEDPTAYEIRIGSCPDLTESPSMGYTQPYWERIKPPSYSLLALVYCAQDEITRKAFSSVGR